ncbi:MAG: biotin carboxylase N-terminal domain-containing protein [Acidimicrobiales bacterium]
MQRVLIANRGEIAIRIAHAAAGLGLESVSIAPPADADALHTRMTTDTLVLPQPGDPVSAYLDIDAVLQAAHDAGCDAVHPGYGFLSENPEFARRCAQVGITFIGPPSEALALFGDKVTARTLAESLGIPVVPGSAKAAATSEDAALVAEAIGYPVMLKAAAGGGGRGMRTVHRTEDMPEAFERSSSEARAAFGNGALFVERLVVDPRHVEVQIMADASGTIVHFYDRDCSVQQRNQKVVEIAPAPNLGDDLRATIHRHAVELVGAADYRNAGTVEFLVEPSTGAHYFIECNPRIQVEHTVTEQVMGVDLVQTQFLIAQGATLDSLGLGSQEAIGSPRGWSIQTRVVATGAGTISGYREPSGPGVRVDGSAYPGLTPPPHFDPLIAKLITSTNGGTLEAAAEQTRRALAGFHIGGLPTNLGQLDAILAHDSVRAGDARTTLVATADGLTASAAVPRTALTELFESRAAPTTSASGPASGPTRTLPVESGHEAVACPMSGSVIDVTVSIGDAVAAGQTLLVVTAMKMGTLITAPCAGTIVRGPTSQRATRSPSGRAGGCRTRRRQWSR